MRFMIMFIKLLILVSLLVQYSSCCTSDSDCSLLGECNQGKCICDPGWKGEKCGQVDLLPAPRDGGYRNATLSSWGGNAIKIDQEWHMFVSAMSHNCSLSDFSTNSLSIHAISHTSISVDILAQSRPPSPPFFTGVWHRC